MTNQFSIMARWTLRVLFGSTLALVQVAPALAQTQLATAVVRYFCYVPGTGTVYAIKEQGTKPACTAPAHIEFTLTDGAGALRAGDAVGGDLAGTLPAPRVQALQGNSVSAATPTADQVLTWDAFTNRWEPKTQSGGAGGDHGSLTGLTDDDHPQYLVLDGHRHSTGGGFAVSGTFGIGKVPVSGAGGRLMYATTAAAFRVGSIAAPFADGWDLHNLGLGSIALGHNVRAHAQNSIVIGQNVAAEPGASSSIVIGANNDPFFLAGTSTPRQFYVFAPGGIVLKPGASGGCELKPGAGAFDCSSDVAGKTDFEVVDAETVLGGVASLPISRWRYTGEPDTVRHLGPTAQDFRAAFGLGAGDRHIGVLDGAGVALTASKALAARTDALAATDAALHREIATLSAEVATLRAAYGELAARLAALENGAAAHR